MGNKSSQTLLRFVENSLADPAIGDPVKCLERFKNKPCIESLIPAERAGIHHTLFTRRQFLERQNFDEFCANNSSEIEVWVEELLERFDETRTKRCEAEDEVRDLLPEPKELDHGRRIVVFIDGTWNTPEEPHHVKKYDPENLPPITNVVRLLRGVVTDNSETDVPQVVGYFRGVGTSGLAASRLIDGATGNGLTRLVVDAYRFISHNLEWKEANEPRPNNSEIFLFGFSRGAYAARALSGFLNRFGLIKKEGLHLLPFFFDKYEKMLATGEDLDRHTELIWEDFVHQEYRSIDVEFLGVWDTVSALGIPVRGLSWLTVNYDDFFETNLTENVSHAYQALAIHEMRQPYKPVLWTRKAKPNQVLEQVWFAGAHANIGGGYTKTGLSSHSLDWMAYKAYAAGLRLDLNFLRKEISTRNSREPIAHSRRWGHGRSGFLNERKVYLRSLSRPVNVDHVALYLKKHFPAQQLEEDVKKDIRVHWSVKDRQSTKVSYSKDREFFEKLDREANTLEVVERRESLFPQRKNCKNST
ncbi:DUF2235 domain-containing protein [Ruegeria arenilitoris]|uniref:DUF2235 domain-containing protein n=1 Tax=Ruegeria arenilitoris TaxID=1173585 RepID=UPI00147DABF2|nr:DUF2235 domain-containing protein [Ruegeria arenilitoris]